MDNGQSGDTSSSPEVLSGHRPTPDVSLALCPSYSLLAWVAGQGAPWGYRGFTWVRFGWMVGCIGAQTCRRGARKWEQNRPNRSAGRAQA